MRQSLSWRRPLYRTTPIRRGPCASPTDQRLPVVSLACTKRMLPVRGREASRLFPMASPELRLWLCLRAPTWNRTENLLIKREAAAMPPDGTSRKLDTSGPADRNETEDTYPMTDRKVGGFVGGPVRRGGTLDPRGRHRRAAGRRRHRPRAVA